MAEMWRLFVAIELPEDLANALHEVQDRLKQHTPSQTVRWVAPQNIHLTLKFLGDTPAVRQNSLETALTRIGEAYHAFDLTAGVLGCFPNTKRPRVIWIGIQEPPDHALSTLYSAIERDFAAMGYAAENRRFSPHLTLGRLNRQANPTDAAQIGNLIAKTTTGDLCRWRVSGISLMRSELKPTGAVYTQLHHAALSQT